MLVVKSTKSSTALNNSLQMLCLFTKNKSNGPSASMLSTNAAEHVEDDHRLPTHHSFELTQNKLQSTELLNSEVYCHGRLLHTIQMAEIYNDSKTFVDMKQKFKPTETLKKFDEFMILNNGNPSKDEVLNFVNTNFEDGNELEPWTPPDFNKHPKFVDSIKDEIFQKWALELNTLWKNLSRKMSSDVQVNPDQYSIIYVPNGLVIPGGRFKEFYYWDSFWVIRGLLLCQMNQTVRGILLNFLSMVNQYGFVPNGGRIYYLERSQVPLLIPMTESYLAATGDLDFLTANINLLEKEFEFWMKNRVVEVKKNGKSYTLARYFAPSSGPRPESYSEDVHTAMGLSNDQDKQDMYIDLKSAAESGWDFSSRWFISNKTNQGNLSTIATRQIIPVDLNAILYGNARILAQFNTILENPQKVDYYSNIAEKWLEAVTAVLWHEDLGVWLDYDILNEVRRDYFYPSNLAPLWTDCYKGDRREEISKAVANYVKKSNVMDFLGGLPSSLELSGEQWDFPNAWPPLQIIAIQGLHNTNVPEAQDLAYTMANNWVHANYIGYNETKEMFEKYDAENPGRFGGGGEYQVQAGFGWTNGVVLELLNTYGDTLSSSSGYITYDKEDEKTQDNIKEIENNEVL